MRPNLKHVWVSHAQPNLPNSRFLIGAHGAPYRFILENYLKHSPDSSGILVGYVRAVLWLGVAERLEKMLQDLAMLAHSLQDTSG